ncbi:MAG: trypsin-like peptidase domain-containing protein [Thermoguttaceae bacterium]|nr:trypsin-like peptidase domain-containing protein [Thermoguttaceae bacterium]MBQ5788949.1 trypsin-like peptidase domain-containing protein [Thermoguttaceae bacterium]
MTNELKFNFENARRAAPFLTVVRAEFEPGKPGVATRLGAGGGSSALIDVRANKAGRPIGLFLTAAHVLDAIADWGLVNFFDADGRAPRQEIAWVIKRYNPGDVAAFFAWFPSLGDVAKPFQIATRRPEQCARLYGAGWGSSERGDRFALHPGRAFGRPPSDAGGGEGVNKNGFPCDNDASHWGWFTALARPGDSGGPVLDAETGALVGIRSGGLAASTNERDVRASRFGRYYSTVDSEFVASVRSDFASKIATKPYRFD